jgi:hypothetical protein
MVLVTRILTITILALMIGGCGDNESSSDTARTPVTDTQLRSLQRAKQVEGVLKRGADRQRRAIDTQ